MIDRQTYLAVLSSLRQMYSPRQRTPGHRKNTEVTVRCPSRGYLKINEEKENNNGTEKRYYSLFFTSCAYTLYPAQAIQYNKCNLTSFQKISKLKTFSECFRRPLKTLWRTTCSPNACTWTTMAYQTTFMQSSFCTLRCLLMYADLWK